MIFIISLPCLLAHSEHVNGQTLKVDSYCIPYSQCLTYSCAYLSKCYEMSILAVLPINDCNVPLSSLIYIWFGILSIPTAGLGFIWKSACDTCMVRCGSSCKCIMYNKFHCTLTHFITVFFRNVQFGGHVQCLLAGHSHPHKQHSH